MKILIPTLAGLLLLNVAVAEVPREYEVHPAAPSPVAMAIQGVNFGSNHPASTRNILKSQCDGELRQLQCRTIDGLEWNDEFCFGICYLQNP